MSGTACFEVGLLALGLAGRGASDGSNILPLFFRVSTIPGGYWTFRTALHAPHPKAFPGNGNGSLKRVGSPQWGHVNFMGMVRVGLLESEARI